MIQPDPYAEARRARGVSVEDFYGERIPMLLRYRDVRAAAKDWRRFSSAAPGRVPIPAETDIRAFRQLPIETDPPEHGEFREIVMPFFRRPTERDVAAGIEALVADAVERALAAGRVEVVGGLALPLQSRALARMLNVEDADAEEWTQWGVHAFRVNGVNIPEKAARLDRYLARKLDEAEARPSGDLFAALTRARVRGRPLTREEMTGFAHLAFAGGRDTVIHLVSGALAHLARAPGDLEHLRAEPRLALSATEEFVRHLSPLAHIGRVCPAGAEVNGAQVAPGERISLCWASANHDETVFEAPGELRLDRRPNPHVGFGGGDHACIGAPLTRLILRTLLREVATKVAGLRELGAEPVRDRFGTPLRFARLELAFERIGEGAVDRCAGV